MAYEQRDMSGVLFKNDRKTSDSQPAYKGNGMVNGQKVWISAWVKEGAKGKFFSLSFTEPEEQVSEKPRPSGTEVAKAAYSRARDDLDAPPF